MELTDDELTAFESVIYDRLHYGDDWIVYAEPGESDYVDALRAGLEKLNAEGKKRKIW